MAMTQRAATTSKEARLMAKRRLQEAAAQWKAARMAHGPSHRLTRLAFREAIKAQTEYQELLARVCGTCEGHGSYRQWGEEVFCVPCGGTGVRAPRRKEVG